MSNSVVYHGRDELERAWLERFQAENGVLRAEVLTTFDEYLNCGLLCHGAARAYCDTCRHLMNSRITRPWRVPLKFALAAMQPLYALDAALGRHHQPLRAPTTPPQSQKTPSHDEILYMTEH